MNKTQLKQLSKLSFTKHELSEAMVNKITSHLSRSELKTYIALLKAELEQKTVLVTTASPIDDSTKKALQKVFGEKKINYQTEKKLLLGASIISNDMVYNMNLRDRLESLNNFINS